MKLSVFTVCTPDLPPEELASAARDAGLHGIEWRYKEVPQGAVGKLPSFWGNNLCSIPPDGDETRLDRFREAADSNGLKSISVTPYLSVGDIDGAERVLQAARSLGASMIRLAVPHYDGSRPFGELFEAERDYLRKMEVVCRRYGIKGLVETHHGTIAASASGAYRLCEGLDPDHIGVLYDPGNMVHEGFENYRMGMELLGPYLAHVHIKNAGWRRTDGRGEAGNAVWSAEWQPMRDGMVPWPRIVEDLKHVGYEGYLGLEDFSGEFESREMLRVFADWFGGLMNGKSA